MAMALGAHRLEYEVIEGWEQMPDGWSFVEVAGVACDSKDRVYVFNRGEHPVIVFDKDGKFLDAWGEGVFPNAHGIYIDTDDNLYLADNHDHTVRKCTPDGKVLFTLGESGKPADTGWHLNQSPVDHEAGPFNGVTNAAVGPKGEIFIADGYGNARVHVFSAEGKLLRSWGTPGTGEGEFNLPHAIAVDSAANVYVADRENSRIQIFDTQGNFKREWAWVGRPDDLFIDAQDTLYIAELGWQTPVPNPPHYHLMQHPPHGHSPIAQVTVCDPDGNVQMRVGGWGNPLAPGNFIVPHGIWIDSHGDMYVGEVVKTSGATKHFAPLTCHSFQKFKRSR
jgi:sugar lactone lactonase YvrE